MRWLKTKLDTEKHSQVCLRDTSANIWHLQEGGTKVPPSFYVENPGNASQSRHYVRRHSHAVSCSVGWRPHLSQAAAGPVFHQWNDNSCVAVRLRILLYCFLPNHLVRLHGKIPFDPNGYIDSAIHRQQLSAVRKAAASIVYTTPSDRCIYSRYRIGSTGVSSFVISKYRLLPSFV